MMSWDDAEDLELSSKEPSPMCTQSTQNQSSVGMVSRKCLIYLGNHFNEDVIKQMVNILLASICNVYC